MPEWVQDIVVFLKSDMIGAFANITGIAGFFITIFVMKTVSQIRSHYTSLVRLPELRSRLQEQASVLGDLLNDFLENEKKIALELAKTLPILNSINKRLNRSEKGTIRSAMKTIKAHGSTALSEKEVRHIYNSLHTINGELEQWEFDKKWGA